MIVAVAALAVPLALFVGASWITYDESQALYDDRLQRTLDILYTSARTTFETEYLVSTNVADLVEEYKNADIPANEAKLHDQLKRLVDALPQVEDVWVLDENGVPLVTAKLYPVPKTFTYADRAYFKALKDGAPRQVSELVHGRIKDIDYFQYAVRRENADKSFKGVIAISITPAYFNQTFARAADLPRR